MDVPGGNNHEHIGDWKAGTSRRTFQIGPGSSCCDPNLGGLVLF